MINWPNFTETQICEKTRRAFQIGHGSATDFRPDAARRPFLQNSANSCRK
jgi:hypothetical protein